MGTESIWRHYLFYGGVILLLVTSLVGSVSAIDWENFDTISDSTCKSGYVYTQLNYQVSRRILDS